MQFTSKNNIKIHGLLQHPSAYIRKQSLDNILQDQKTSNDVIDAYKRLIANAVNEIEEKRVLVIQTHMFQTMQSPELMKSYFRKLTKKQEDSNDPEDLFDYAVTACVKQYIG